MQYNDHVSNVWKHFPGESMGCLPKVSQNFGNIEIVEESYDISCHILHLL